MPPRARQQPFMLRGQSTLAAMGVGALSSIVTSAVALWTKGDSHVATNPVATSAAATVTSITTTTRVATQTVFASQVPETMHTGLETQQGGGLFALSDFIFGCLEAVWLSISGLFDFSNSMEFGTPNDLSSLLVRLMVVFLSVFLRDWLNRVIFQRAEGALPLWMLGILRLSWEAWSNVTSQAHIVYSILGTVGLNVLPEWTLPLEILTAVLIGTFEAIYSGMIGIDVTRLAIQRAGIGGETDRLRQELFETQKSIDSKRKELVDVETALTVAKLKCEVAQTNLRDKEAEFREKEAEMDPILQRFEQSAGRLERMNDDLATATADLNKTQKQLRASKGELVELSFEKADTERRLGTIKSLTTRFSELPVKYDSGREELKALEEVVIELRQQLHNSKTQAENELKRANTCQADLDGIVDFVSAGHYEPQNQYEQTVLDIVSKIAAKSENTGLSRGKLQGLTEQLHALQEMEKKIQTEKTKRRRLVQKVKEKMVSVKDVKEALHQRYQRQVLNLWHAAYKFTLDGRRTRRALLKELKALKITNNDLKDKNDGLNEKVSSTQKQLEGRVKQVDKCVEAAKQLIIERHNLKKALDAATGASTATPTAASTATSTTASPAATTAASTKTAPTAAPSVASTPASTKSATTAASTTAAITAAPTTTAPTAAPTKSATTAAPTKSATTAAPMKTAPTAAPTKTTPTAAPTKTAPTAASTTTAPPAS